MHRSATSPQQQPPVGDLDLGDFAFPKGISISANARAGLFMSNPPSNGAAGSSGKAAVRPASRVAAAPSQGPKGKKPMTAATARLNEAKTRQAQSPGQKMQWHAGEMRWCSEESTSFNVLDGIKQRDEPQYDFYSFL
jgi:hypothetical protein